METFPLLGGQLQWLRQAQRPSEDAFWLAAAANPPAPTATVLDAGCGSGAVGLSLLGRCPQCQLTGLDLNPDRIAEAVEHARLNRLSANFAVADVLADGAASPPKSRYAVVLCNPPFHLQKAGFRSINPAKQLAHGLVTLTPWLAALQGYCTREGALYLLLHTALAEPLQQGAQPYGGRLQTRLLASHPARPAKRLLARWAPAAGQPLAYQALPLIPAHHTTLREAVLRGGQSLAALGFGW